MLKGFHLSRKKRLLHGGNGILVLLIILIIVALTTNVIKFHDNEPDLSFLNINNTLSIVAQSFDGILVEGLDKGQYIVDPHSDLMQLFDVQKWEVLKDTSRPISILVPHIIFDLSRGDTIHHLHLDSNSDLAEIQYNDQYRYYRIPDDVVEGIEEYILKYGKLKKDESNEDIFSYKILIGENKYYVRKE